jgi:hypothetical protein
MALMRPIVMILFPRSLTLCLGLHRMYLIVSGTCLFCLFGDNLGSSRTCFGTLDCGRIQGDIKLIKLNVISLVLARDMIRVRSVHTSFSTAIGNGRFLLQMNRFNIRD